MPADLDIEMDDGMLLDLRKIAAIEGVSAEEWARRVLTEWASSVGDAAAARGD